MSAPTPPPERPSPGDITRFEAIANVVSVIMAVAVGGSAAVVAALGQLALAGVLALVALGIVLRLWRRRRRLRARRTP
ncbi:hypothetical protein FVQ98_09480 [Ottowia sp. GY511]|uniref:LPXTG cell wall anchor domain-containing protein n=1 Tax=Ottowia flava TaxID=2675430 RepID=A0ABW4KWS5_9BURK|nr:hypothetical protein [Ottowia sp. GY511]TXK28527.1 hypothetical protein FVQ98_09480 [Ottowia sp. GY511]